MPSNVICAPHRPASRLRWPLRSSARRRWAMLSFPLLLSACCATQPVTVTTIPANLDRPCSPGPALPEGDVRLSVLLPIMAEREAAARECRARTQGLRAAWPR